MKQFRFQLGGKQFSLSSTGGSQSNYRTLFNKVIVVLFYATILIFGFSAFLDEKVVNIQSLYTNLSYFLGILSAIYILLNGIKKQIPLADLVFLYSLFNMIILLLTDNRYVLLGSSGFLLDSGLTFLSLVGIYIFVNDALINKNQISFVLLTTLVIGLFGSILNPFYITNFGLLGLLLLPLILNLLSARKELIVPKYVLYFIFALNILFVIVYALNVEYPWELAFVAIVLSIYSLRPAFSELKNFFSRENGFRLERVYGLKSFITLLLSIIYFILAIYNLKFSGFSTGNIQESYGLAFDRSFMKILFGAGGALKSNYPFLGNTTLALGLVGLALIVILGILFIVYGYKQRARSIYVNSLLVFVIIRFLTMFVIPLSAFDFAIWWIILSVLIAFSKKELEQGDKVS